MTASLFDDDWSSDKHWEHSPSHNKKCKKDSDDKKCHKCECDCHCHDKKMP